MPVRTTAEYDADEEWLAIGSGTWLPKHFRVTRSSGQRSRVPDVVVVVHVELVDAAIAAGVTLYDEPCPAPVARTVTVSRTYGEVFEKDLRDVPVVELVEDGSAALSRSSATAALPGKLLERGGGQIRRLNAAAASTGDTRELKRARRPLHLAPIDLGLVALTYQEALNTGRRDPTIAVAERIDRSRSSAAGYVRQARQKGLLPPVATGEGTKSSPRLRP